MTTLACRRNPLRGLMRRIQCNIPSCTTNMHVHRLYYNRAGHAVPSMMLPACQHAASVECWATHRVRQTTLRQMPARITSHNTIRVQGKLSLIMDDPSSHCQPLPLYAQQHTELVVFWHKASPGQPWSAVSLPAWPVARRCTNARFRSVKKPTKLPMNV
jgi:hypothetical protein